jgi:methyl-accepting chemotaxis protein
MVTFTIRPDSKMPDGFDRARPGKVRESSSPALTEPYIDLATGQLVISIVTV